MFKKDDDRLDRLEEHLLAIKEDLGFIKGRIQQKENSGIITSTVVSTIVAAIIGLFKP